MIKLSDIRLPEKRRSPISEIRATLQMSPIISVAKTRIVPDVKIVGRDSFMASEIALCDCNDLRALRYLFVSRIA